jgi:DNA invertase Pin-like site-specific DNA recombinase
MSDKPQFIAYYRVSTDKQGRSGLGLEAQQRDVENYLRGVDGDLIDTFTEVETGKGANALKKRPQLDQALAACKKHGTTLLIAKLDRLARNVAFVANLMERKVPFVAADMPSANDFMLHIYAAVAEEERRMISKRTRAALAVAKARGVELGKHGKVLAAQHKAKAEAFAHQIAPTVQQLRGEGFQTTRAITEALNSRGIPTPGGGSWHLSSTHKLLKRIDGQNQHQGAGWYG